MALRTNDPLVVAALTTIRIGPRLHACRDAAQWPLGDNSELGDALTNAANAANCHVLQAATKAARSIDALDAMQVLAPAVELVEPSA